MLKAGDNPLRGLAAICAALVVGVALAGPDSTGQDPVRQAALALGSALVKADPALLRPILPEHGTIRADLVRLGPAAGPYGASQFEALIKDFLRLGSVRAFDLLRVESHGSGYGIAHARSRLADREGQTADVDLRLAFESEGRRLVLKAIQETPR